MSFLVNDPYRKVSHSQFCSDRIQDDTDMRFVFKFHCKKMDRRKVGETMHCLVTKSSENVAFCLHFACARLVKGVKSLYEERAT